MTDPVEPLILDLLEWIGPRARPYTEVLEAWRTSCPRLPVWEEANSRGLIDHVHEQGQPAQVAVSFHGRSWLASQRGNLSSTQAVRSAAVLGESARDPAVTPMSTQPPNPSIEGTSTSGLRPLAAAPHVKR